MSNRVLPQDDTCHCGRRIGNHDQYHMWVCLQSAGRLYRQLIKSIQQSKEESHIG
jgi:hypothetical protein